MSVAARDGRLSPCTHIARPRVPQVDLVLHASAPLISCLRPTTLSHVSACSHFLVCMHTGAQTKVVICDNSWAACLVSELLTHLLRRTAGRGLGLRLLVASPASTQWVMLSPAMSSTSPNDAAHFSDIQFILSHSESWATQWDLQRSTPRNYIWRCGTSSYT